MYFLYTTPAQVRYTIGGVIYSIREWHEIATIQDPSTSKRQVIVNTPRVGGDEDEAFKFNGFTYKIFKMGTKEADEARAAIGFDFAHGGSSLLERAMRGKGCVQWKLCGDLRVYFVLVECHLP